MSTPIPFIDLQEQRRRIQKSLESRMKAVLDHGGFILGPEVKDLEKKLEDFTGAKHCISVANGTDALQIVMMALGIGPGDEVISPDFTFFATAETIAILGAKPVFVDVDPETYNISVAEILKKITPKTKAIIPVSLYGQCAEMNEIIALGKEKGIPVIEDAAQSFGATYQGKKSCNLSHVSCTSFFPSKPLGCYGDGGAIFTNDDTLATTLRQIRAHGQEKRYFHKIVGVNSRLDTLQAAVLLAKMEIFEEEIRLRDEVAARYHRLLEGIVKTPKIKSGRTSAWAQYTIEVENREAFMKKLEEKGVPTTVHYPMPMHNQPAMQVYANAGEIFPVSERVSKRVLSIPMHPYLDEKTQLRIVDAIKSSLA